jgi:TetR/AcrR family transcriptional regulator, acrAB operon repressor
LPIEDMVAKSAEDDAADPLALLKEAAVGALRRTATDPQCQRVFDIVTHKCEYLEDMAGVKRRVSDIKSSCVARAERAIRLAIRRGQLPKTLDARLVAVGLDAMIFGLISNWLADHHYVKLERDAEALVDHYLACLRAEPAARPVRSRVKRAAKARTKTSA